MPKTPPTPSSRQLSDKKKRVIVIIICLVSAVLINAAIFYSRLYFAVKNVVIHKGQSKQTVKGLGIFKDTNMLFLDEKKSQEQLYKNNSYIRDIKVRKIFPDTISITVQFWQPSAQLEVSEGYFNLSSDGRILKKIKNAESGLPILHFYQKLSYTGYQAGDFVMFKDIKASLVFLQKAKDSGLDINSIDITGSNMIALKTETQKVVFGVEKSLKDQLYQFEKVVRQLKIQGKQFKTLDFRFDRVIIGE